MPNLDTQKVIISYLAPHELYGFFVQHNISFSINFKYDLSNFIVDMYFNPWNERTDPNHLSLHNFESIFKHFSSISFVGITLWTNYMWIDLKKIFDVLNISDVRTLKYITISNVDNEISLLDISILNTCPNLRTLMIYRHDLVGGSLNIRPYKITFDHCKNVPHFDSTKIRMWNAPEQIPQHCSKIKSLSIYDSNTNTHFNPPNYFMKLDDYVSLHTIQFICCYYITTIDLWSCSNLKTIKLSDCDNLSSITICDQKIRHLEHFEISNCNKIQSLNFLIWHTNLKFLVARRCRKLTINPNILGKNMRIIYIQDIMALNVEKFLDAIWQCTKLEKIIIDTRMDYHNHLVTDINKFMNCSVLELIHCIHYFDVQIINLELLVNFANLKSVYIMRSDLQSVKFLGECKQLEKIFLRECHLLKDIDGLGDSVRLVDVCDCNELINIDNLGGCIGLNIGRCGLVKNLEYMRGSRLKILHIHKCYNFTHFGFKESFPQLEEIYIRNSKLEDVSELNLMCPNLVHMCFTNCDLLYKGFNEEFKMLKSIQLINCDNIVSIRNLNPIWFVVAQDCKSLKYTPLFRNTYYRETPIVEPMQLICVHDATVLLHNVKMHWRRLFMM